MEVEGQGVYDNHSLSRNQYYVGIPFLHSHPFPLLILVLLSNCYSPHDLVIRFSMAMMISKNNDLIVASGTVQSDIVIWNASSILLDGENKQTIQRLVGHEVNN